MFSRSKDRRDLICVAALLLLWVVVWLPRLKGPIDLRWDASAYYVLGTALAEGKGYRLLNEPGNIEAVQYPPLLPLLVAVHQLVLGTTDFLKVGWALRLTYFILSGLFLLTAYALARKLLSPLYALLVAAITALSFYSFLHPSDTLYAEMPFGLVSMLFLLCQRRDERALNTVISGFLGAAAYLLRTAGIALLLAWIAESLLRRHFRQAIIRAVVSAIPILLWQAHIWRVTGSDQYRHPSYAYQRAPYYYSNVTYGENSKFIDAFHPELGRISAPAVVRRIASNLLAAPLGLGESALIDHRFGIPGHWQRSSFLLQCGLIVVGLGAIAGAAMIATGTQWFLSLYFALVTGLITLTPWQNQFWRYFAPLAPLTLIFLVVFLLGVLRWLSQHFDRWGRYLGRVVTVSTLIGILVVQVIVAIFFLRTKLLPVSHYRADGRERTLPLLTYEAAWHSTDPAFEWIRRNAARDAVVATTVPHMAYIRSGHKAVLFPFELNVDLASDLMKQVPVNYIVLDELGGPHLSERFAAPVIERRPEEWRLVFSAPDGKAHVYERTR